MFGCSLYLNKPSRTDMLCISGRLPAIKLYLHFPPKNPSIFETPNNSDLTCQEGLKIRGGVSSWLAGVSTWLARVSFVAGWIFLLAGWSLFLACWSLFWPTGWSLFLADWLGPLPAWLESLPVWLAVKVSLLTPQIHNSDVAHLTSHMKLQISHLTADLTLHIQFSDSHLTP